MLALLLMFAACGAKDPNRSLLVIAEQCISPFRHFAGQRMSPV